MRKILISTIIIAMITGGLSAQDVTFGVRGGVNFSNMMPAGEATPLNDGFSMRPAPSFGIFTELQVNPTVSFRLGVEYNGFGGRRDGMQAFPTQRLVTEIAGSLGMIGMVLPDVMEQAMGFMNMWSADNPFYYANVENTIKINYITVPLLAQFGTNIGTSPWRVYANVGPTVWFILSAEEVTRGTSQRYMDAAGTTTLWNTVPSAVQDIVEGTFPGIAATFRDPVSFGTTDITGEMRSVNLGVSGNLGIRYQHNRHNFFVEVGGNYGFLRVQQNTNNGGNRLGALSVVLGYSFSLW
ncbi:MAG: PorT family protein [Bacteroidales bacterium]|nr:PorT family protein [Bacteroidales bacterium]